jgi:hypothetical protein
MLVEKSALPFSETKIQYPKTYADVDNSIKDMDKKYGTTFYSWIKSEENIGYLCTFKRQMFDQYFESRPESLIYAIQWLTSEWSIPSIAELLLKLFYHYRLESEKFCFVLKGLTKEWKITRIVELINVLLIGENASSTAEFVVKFTVEWNNQLVVELINYLSASLKWNQTFFKNFLINYISLRCSSKDMESDLIELVKKNFDINLNDPIKKSEIYQYQMNGMQITQIEGIALFRVINEAMSSPVKRVDSKFDLDILDM